MAWWIVPIGMVLGVIVGALGGGGSILAIPVLVYLLGQSPAAATTGSLVIVTLTSIAGLAAHLRSGCVRVGTALAFGGLGVVGAFLGSLAATRVDGQVLLSAFCVLLFVVATLMVRRRHRATCAERAGKAPSALSRARPLSVFAAATGVGALTGFFGVGGGFAIVPALTLVLGMSMPVAIGTSLLVIILNSATALIARAPSLPQLDWPLIGVFSLAAMTGSILGAWTSKRTNRHTLTLAFAILLYAVALYTGAQTIPAWF
ncbi:sulfite exporter TauE/SafE family protein [Gephyromycinifex aptenodytis]|uniref:sulfite exporter TauE/SafE family protein n=1 Tax=Gephyromycinifex aptenodytis TaxID=2716227 RepID=UPI001D00488D|nr:sulfite exporter TauE/SafE family protein [Gephyromycinifex aptenodytis]